MVSHPPPPFFFSWVSLWLPSGKTFVKFVCYRCLSAETVQRTKELKTLNLHTGAEFELLYRARTVDPLTY